METPVEAAKPSPRFGSTELKTALNSVGSPRRAMTFIAIGVLAGLMEAAAGRVEMISAESAILPRAVYAAVIAAGLALEAGFPLGRLKFVLVWSFFGAFCDALISPYSSGVARAALGGFIGASLAASWPLQPVPWVAITTGAIGAAAGAVLAHVAGALEAPVWALPGIETLVLGIFLTQGRPERLRGALLSEESRIHRYGTEQDRAYANRIIEVAVASIEEIDAREERCGEDLEPARAEVARRARFALGLLRRLAALPSAGEDLRGRIESHLHAEIAAMEAAYRKEMEQMME